MRVHRMCVVIATRFEYRARVITIRVSRLCVCGRWWVALFAAQSPERLSPHASHLNNNFLIDHKTPFNARSLARSVRFEDISCHPCVILFKQTAATVARKNVLVSRVVVAAAETHRTATHVAKHRHIEGERERVKNM